MYEIERILCCTLVINVIIFLLVFLYLKFGGEYLSEVHAKWYKIKPEKVRERIYFAMLIYKIMIIFFVFVPYLVIAIRS